MIKKLLTIIAVFCSGLLIFVFTNFKYPGGAPAGYTGSPADGKNCTACHKGSAANMPNIINSNVGANGYTPGTKYVISVTVIGNSAKGFQVSPQDASGNLLGTLSAGTGSTVIGSGKYITHSADITTNPAVWVFNWTAPKQGTGSVTFYGAFANGKSTTYLSTLVIPEYTVGISERDNNKNLYSIYPNPANDFISISYYLSSANHLKIYIYSCDGKIIASLFNESLAAGNYVKSFILPEGMEKGLYFVRIEEGDNTITRKLFKL